MKRKVILNVSGRKSYEFTAQHMLAKNGKVVVDYDFTTIDEFIEYYDKYQTVIGAVIVSKDPNHTIRNNDIANAITCPLLTLDIVVDCDSGVVSFLEYE